MSRRSGVSILVRNLSRRIRADDLRHEFERVGKVRDIYIPRDYYTGEPRGFAFVEFLDPRDAEDAVEELDQKMIDGRPVTVIFAQERRKTADEMRTRERRSRSPRRGRDRDRRRSRSRDRNRDRSRDKRRSRSPRDRSPRRSRDRSPKDRSPRDRSPKDRSPERSASRSPEKEKDDKDAERSASRSPEDRDRKERSASRD